jgi:hypothetical protein
MSRRIIEIYVAAVCFAATLSVLLTAPHFFRARLENESAQSDLRYGLVGLEALTASKVSDGGEQLRVVDKQMARAKKAEMDYNTRREYLLLAGAVLAGHVVFLVAAEVIFWRRTRGRITATA